MKDFEEIYSLSREFGQLWLDKLKEDSDSILNLQKYINTHDNYDNMAEAMILSLISYIGAFYKIEDLNAILKKVIDLTSDVINKEKESDK